MEAGAYDRDDNVFMQYLKFGVGTTKETYFRAFL